MNPIRRALVERAVAYTAGTQRTIALFEEKLNKATQYFIKIDRDVNWISVEAIQGAEDFIYIAGLLEVKEGDVLNVNDGNQVMVDAEFIRTHSSKTLVRLMLNIDDLDTLTPKEIYEKIKDFYDVASTMSHEQIARNLANKKVTNLKDLLHTPVDAALETPFHESEEPETPPTPAQNYNFDFSALTEDQILQVKINSSVMSKAKN